MVEVRKGKWMNTLIENGFWSQIYIFLASNEVWTKALTCELITYVLFSAELKPCVYYLEHVF